MTKTKCGFTLVELMIVMAIISLLAAVAIPAFFSWLPDMKMKAVARDLFSKMQQTRLLAIKENRNFAIFFDVPNNQYEVRHDYGPDGIPNNGSIGEGDGVCSPLEILETIVLSNYGSGVTFGSGAATADVSATAWPSGPVSYAGDLVTFNPKGTGNNGYVYVTNQNNVECIAVGTLTSGATKIRRSLGGAAWEQ